MKYNNHEQHVNQSSRLANKKHWLVVPLALLGICGAASFAHADNVHADPINLSSQKLQANSQVSQNNVKSATGSLVTSSAVSSSQVTSQSSVSSSLDFSEGANSISTRMVHQAMQTTPVKIQSHRQLGAASTVNTPVKQVLIPCVLNGDVTESIPVGLHVNRKYMLTDLASNHGIQFNGYYAGRPSSFDGYIIVNPDGSLISNPAGAHLDFEGRYSDGSVSVPVQGSHKKLTVFVSGQTGKDYPLSQFVNFPGGYKPGDEVYGKVTIRYDGPKLKNSSIVLTQNQLNQLNGVKPVKPSSNASSNKSKSKANSSSSSNKSNSSSTNQGAKSSNSKSMTSSASNSSANPTKSGTSSAASSATSGASSVNSSDKSKSSVSSASHPSSEASSTNSSTNSATVKSSGAKSSSSSQTNQTIYVTYYDVTKSNQLSTRAFSGVKGESFSPELLSGYKWYQTPQTMKFTDKPQSISCYVEPVTSSSVTSNTSTKSANSSNLPSSASSSVVTSSSSTNLFSLSSLVNSSSSSWAMPSSSTVWSSTASVYPSNMSQSMTQLSQSVSQPSSRSMMPLSHSATRSSQAVQRSNQSTNGSLASNVASHNSADTSSVVNTDDPNDLAIGQAMKSGSGVITRVQPKYGWFTVDKTCLAHYHIGSIGSVKDYGLVLHAGDSVQIVKTFKLTNGGHHVDRYEIRVNGHNYYVTGNVRFTNGDYYKPKNINAGRVYKTAKGRHYYKALVLRNCMIHSKNRSRLVRSGRIIHIKRVVYVGRKGKRMPRFELTNGKYITANKAFVKLI